MTNNFNTDFFQDFIADSFARNQKEWAKYAKYIALNFLREYNKNVNFMLYKMNSFNKKELKSLSSIDKCQAKVIMNFVSLRSFIIIDQSNNDLEIKFDEIKKSFVRVTEKKELKEATNAIAKLDQQSLSRSRFYSTSSNKEVGSFQKLHNFYVLLISFIQEENQRKEFYLGFVAKDELKEINNFSFPSQGQPTRFYNDVV